MLCLPTDQIKKLKWWLPNGTIFLILQFIRSFLYTSFVWSFVNITQKASCVNQYNDDAHKTRFSTLFFRAADFSITLQSVSLYRTVTVTVIQYRDFRWTVTVPVNLNSWKHKVYLVPVLSQLIKILYEILYFRLKYLFYSWNQTLFHQSWRIKLIKMTFLPPSECFC